MTHNYGNGEMHSGGNGGTVPVLQVLFVRLFETERATSLTTTTKKWVAFCETKQITGEMDTRDNGNTVPVQCFCSTF